MPNDLLREYQKLNARGQVDLFHFLTSKPQSSPQAKLKVVLHDLEQRWKIGKPLRLEDYLERIPDLANDPQAILAMVKSEQLAQVGIDTTPELADIAKRFPQVADRLMETFRTIDSKSPESPDLFRTDRHHEDPSSVFVLGSRYRIIRLLGQGAFGRVYLALDVDLQRQVAIKVPLSERFHSADDAEDYLAEARTVARLNHPHIVPVYDMGRTPEGAVFVVSRFIEGTTLDDRLKSEQFAPRELVSLLKTVAEALHYAHGLRLIHRDVKPDNILIEEGTGTPYIADFGLAIKEEDYAKQAGLAGTPTYMSPEQARGEGHRLDCRSDVFSLGVIMYEGLTGQRPFRGSTLHELLHQVISVEPRAPRSLRDDIPAELERICLKALTKRVSDRYSSAAAMAEDLAAWLLPQALSSENLAPYEEQIVPKGLRSFDATDASYFLDLLPGPRNRDGLPESIAFWKQRIEQADAEQTFSVGLIYGPSGCGKSSLVKAGLIPSLDKEVAAIYIEATPEDTETRILRGLRKRFPDLPAKFGLADTFAALRRAQGRKVVVILDQFEQWLHSHQTDSMADLTAALRHCDGGHLQAIIMVRDDFAMAASRFMKALDTRILEGENFATVDLFDIEHAAKVLTKFGQAFGKLPSPLSKITEPERDFVRAVANGLAVDGKVVSVRLSLFAEMIRDKPWLMQTLEEVGGTKGVGVNFLEETFSSRDANPDHRVHEVAARGILNALLPDLGTDIKGHMRSQTELMSAAGYQDRPSDFNDLLRMLDGELRLITPTDPEGHDLQSRSGPVHQYFQLTHDYLVPSLREWLTRKQRESKEGRAEIKLAERASAWNAKRESKQLPTAMEWLSITYRTSKSRWTAIEKDMMRRANAFHLTRFLTAAIIVGAMASGGIWTWHRVDQNRRELLAQKAKEQEETRTKGLVDRLVSAEPSELPEIVGELEAYAEVAEKFLAPFLTLNASTAAEKHSKLHARLAMVSRDKSLVDPLLEELFTNKVAYVAPIRRLLRAYSTDLTERLRSILQDENAETNRRFRAAMVLADYAPQSESNRWTDADLEFVASELVVANAEFQPMLRENLRPIRDRLLVALETIFSDPKSSNAQRLSAANAFADYASRDVEKLSSLLAVSNPEQYAVLYPLVAASPLPSTMEEFSATTATLPSAELGSSARIAFGTRRANMAVTLLRLGEREKVLPVFDMTDDPEAMTQFIFHCRERGVRAEELLDLMKLIPGTAEGTGTDSTGRSISSKRDNARILYAIFLALGEYSLNEIPDWRREELLKQLAAIYRDAPSSGLHSASGWLLRRWGQTEAVRAVDQTPMPYSPDREWFTLAIQVIPNQATNSKGKSARVVSDAGETSSEKSFYYTFIVFPPGTSQVGSVVDEPDRQKEEIQHSVSLTRPFALLDREITLEELIAFKPVYAEFMQRADAKPKDAGYSADWYDCVAFCRWLSQQTGVAEEAQSYEDPESLDTDEFPRDPTPNVSWATRDWPLRIGRTGFRLPTESEWEFACRGGTRTAYCFGSDIGLLNRFGWFAGNSGKHVHATRELRPSVRGLFDMHGNVYEWTHDWYFNYPKKATIDPVISEKGTMRVGRGGAWNRDAANARSAYRSPDIPTIRTPNCGLRLALSLQE